MDNFFKLPSLYVRNVYFLLLLKIYICNIFCKQLFNIKSKQNTEHSTIEYNSQLIIKQACCIKARMDFIPHSLWPPNCPDLNAVDCAVWWILPAHLLGQGRERATPACRGESYSVDQRVIDSAVREWHKRPQVWWRTFQTCTVNTTDLLRALMQRTCLFINWILCWILWILLLCLGLIFNSCLQRIYMVYAKVFYSRRKYIF